MNMETIIICSPDDKNWERFGDISWPNFKDVEKDTELVNEMIRKSGKEDTHYFEAVFKEFFEEFRHPFL